jgi:molybdopterin molybdotransferase
MLSTDECLEFLLAKASLLCDMETIATEQALGRVLAADQVSTVTVPPHDNSAMDGYAVRVSDLDGEHTELPVSQRIAAGQVGEPLAVGTAARIFTGAPIPPGADAVIMQEQTRQQGEQVIISGMHKAGQNIRRAGEDLKTGDVVLQQGRRLRPQDLGLAASVGLASLPVYRRLKVAIFSTGDELVAPGQPLQPGQIYNSNRYTLTGLLQNIQCEIIDLGNVADDMASTLEVLQQAADQADLIVTSGGVSVGEEDYIKAALEQLGQVEMWRVAMKPGKPLAYGHVGETPFIGLPGNPVSVFATFLLFARPYLLRSMGASQVRTTRMKVTADFDWQRAGPRREFVRARLGHDAQGRPSASIYPSQSSGVMTSTVWADGLVIIPENTTISAGDSVDYLSFDSLLA